MNQFHGGNQLLNAQSILEKVGITERMIVADLGCGNNGHFCFPAAHLVGGKGLVYAVDVRKSVLQNVKTRTEMEGLNNMRPIWSNLEMYGSTDIRSSFIDLALLVNILFQSQKHFEILKEAIRLMKKGGKLLVIDWKKTSAAMGPSLDLRVDKRDIQMMLYRLGIEQTEDFDAGKHHFGMLFEK
ncbi:methyltransferase domain-containing protein [Candidatus Falkowbacteria bacterium]|jgi:ubiquinone/menaquinone biosynthesis C-methylase UbiE|nr:methyltransferase domain-containing protein [Candidatus Falkowbacteria bacterium]